MKINYSKILRKNMINVLKDVLKEIQLNGLQENHHLYITFNTKNEKATLPDWLKERYPNEMTIIIQYEYWNFIIKKDSFNIGLSFDGIKTDLNIHFDSVISFADPYANFGLKLIKDIKKTDSYKSKKNIKKINNVINFKKFKKN
jgi:hypothetical protein